MKKITGLVVVLAALILGSYYGMGVMTERALRKNIETVNRTNGLHAEIVDYQRGWFTSQAKLTWNVHIPEHVVNQDGNAVTVAAADFDTAMPLDIWHGPVIFGGNGVHFGLGFAQTTLQMPTQLREQFGTVFTQDSVEPSLTLNFLVEYSGETRVGGDVPGFTLVWKEGNARFQWLGMDSSLLIGRDGDELSGRFEIQGMNAAKDQNLLTVGTVKSSYSLHKNDLGMYLGEAKLDLANLSASADGQKLLDLESFDVTSTSGVKEGLFSTGFELSVQKLQMDGKSWGPGVLEVKLENLDAATLAKLNTQIKGMQNASDADKQQAMFAMLPELPTLFGQGAVLEISQLRMTMPQGVIEGNLRIALPKGNTINPLQLLQSIAGNGKLKLPAAVLKDVMRMGNLQKQLKQQQMQQSMAAQVQPATSTATDAQPASVAVTQTVPAGSDTEATPAAQQATGSAAAPAAGSPAAQTAAPVASVTPAMSADELAKQADVMTDDQIANMLKAGLLVQQGSDYVLEVSLTKGQITVNGKPFSPAMLQY